MHRFRTRPRPKPSLGQVEVDAHVGKRGDGLVETEVSDELSCTSSSTPGRIILTFLTKTDGRHQDVLKTDGDRLLAPSDPSSQRVARITSRLITALEEQQHLVISDAAWPPRSSELSRVISEREAGQGRALEDRFKPSGVAHSSFTPFRPASSNPLKKIESADWNLYVIDMVS